MLGVQKLLCAELSSMGDGLAALQISEERALPNRHGDQ